VEPVFPVCALDKLAKQARLHVYTTFTTSCSTCTSTWAVLRRLREELSSEGVDLIAVPIDQADDDSKLNAYAQQWKPASRLVNIPQAKRADIAAAYAQVLGQVPPLPSTVITDDSGHVLAAAPGLPSISGLRSILFKTP
jgi:hypothetical protein